jgi:hypothetical protein
VKALIAELRREIALCFTDSELVYANLDEALVVRKPMKSSLLQGQGLNLAHFLSGAINFDPVVTVVDAKLA